MGHKAGAHLPAAAAIPFHRAHKKPPHAGALDDDIVVRVGTKVPPVSRHKDEPNSLAYDDVRSVFSEWLNAPVEGRWNLGQELLSRLCGKPFPYGLLLYLAEFGRSPWVIRGNPELSQRFAPLHESTPDFCSEAVGS